MLPIDKNFDCNEKRVVMSAERIGIIEDHRLLNLPVSCHAAHEFCFHLHDQMVSLLANGEMHSVDEVSLQFESFDQQASFVEKDNLIEGLEEIGQEDKAKEIVSNRVTVALFSDLLHFVYEALRTLEKRKFTVTFALLRKPLRENLMFATWLYASPNNFYQCLRESPSSLMDGGSLKPERKIELFEKTIQSAIGMDFVDAKKLYAIIFDKQDPNSFSTMFDMANHLVTSHSAMRTEQLNLNFIFKSAEDNDIYQSIYADLSYVLMYAKVLMVNLYGRMSPVEQSYLDYILSVSLGSYTSIFVPGYNPLIRQFNKTLEPFLICPHCGAKLKIKKKQAARFFINESLDCYDCGDSHNFPFFWLLSKSKFHLEDDRFPNSADFT